MSAVALRGQIKVSFRAGITCDCQLYETGTRSGTQIACKQYVLLITEPSLQSQACVFKI